MAEGWQVRTPHEAMWIHDKHLSKEERDALYRWIFSPYPTIDVQDAAGLLDRTGTWVSETWLSEEQARDWSYRPPSQCSRVDTNRTRCMESQGFSDVELSRIDRIKKLEYLNNWLIDWVQTHPDNTLGLVERWGSVRCILG